MSDSYKYYGKIKPGNDDGECWQWQDLGEKIE